MTAETKTYLKKLCQDRQDDILRGINNLEDHIKYNDASYLKDKLNKLKEELVDLNLARLEL